MLHEKLALALVGRDIDLNSRADSTKLCKENYHIFFIPQTGNKLLTVHEHSKQINDIQMYKDQTMFVTASKDHTAKVSTVAATEVQFVLIFCSSDSSSWKWATLWPEWSTVSCWFWLNIGRWAPPASPFDLPLFITGFVRSLEFAKRSRVCPAIFQTWKKSRRIVKGLDYYYFFKATIS